MRKKFVTVPEVIGTRRYVIEHDESAGFYLFVYEGNRCVCDELQDSLDMAKCAAEEDFSVPKASWIPA